MRGQDNDQGAMFSYITLEQRIPADHPLRAIRALTAHSGASIGSWTSCTRARAGIRFRPSGCCGPCC